MEKNALNLGDLVKLDGLEKPADVLKKEMWGRPDKIAEYSQVLGSFAGNIEDDNQLSLGEIVTLAEGFRRTVTFELMPEQAKQFMAVMKRRFLNKNVKYRKAEGIYWGDVEKKLLESPDKLRSLYMMDSTGGKPDVLRRDGQTGEFIFVDFSFEIPKGRRNCLYNRKGEEYAKRQSPGKKFSGNAVDIAGEMGVELLTEEDYLELQTKGLFDKKGWNWLLPDDEAKKRNSAKCGRVFFDQNIKMYLPDIQEADVYTTTENDGFRALLRV